MKLQLHKSCERLANTLSNHLLPGLLDISPSKSHDEPFKNTRFFSLALKCCMDDGIEWAEQLKSAPQRHDWHLISMDIRGHNSIHVAKSKNVAIAYVVQQLDEYAEFISQIETGRCSVRFCKQDKILATVEPLPITSPATELSRRITRCFERAQTNSTVQELRQRFKSIRGLETIKPNELDNRATRPYTLSAASLANQMTAFLSQISSKEFARSEVLEITAKFFGFQSWNHFTGAEKKHRDSKSFEYPYKISWGTENGDMYTLGVSDAFAYFAGTVAAADKHPQEIVIHRYLGFGATAHYHNTQLHMNLLDVVTVDNLTDRLGSETDEGTVLDKLGGSTNGNARLAYRAQRRSIDGTYALVGAWLVYIELGRWDHHRLVLERYTPDLTQCLERIATNQYKCSLQFSKEGEIWLAPDWDRKPVYKLTGLKPSEACQIEDMFINHENRFLNAVA